MSIFTNRRIVLGITGGVAAYKSADLARQLIKAGATVDCVLSESATRFVTPQTFQALTGRPARTELWDDSVHNNMAHIDLTRGADMLLIAPATANTLAKIAHGIADNLLTSLVLARDCPLAVAPAMNRQMWENPATQRNVAQLAADGIRFFGPAAGEQACGEIGMGRMLEPLEIVEELAAALSPKLLAGRRVLITAGPTLEAIDPVRGITNISSGKMGFALARACHRAGARVTLVAGPVSQSTPRGVERIDVVSAAQMRDAVLRAVGDAEVFIAASPRSPTTDRAKSASTRSRRMLGPASRWNSSRIRTSSPKSRRGPIRRSASASPPRAAISTSTRARSGSKSVCRCWSAT